jgi:hypothetical protein
MAKRFMKTHFIISFLFAGLLTSCSPTYTYFTKSLYEEQQWTPDDITRIQFYVSKDIVLSRSMSTGESSISGGKILIKDGQRIEQVIIRSGTPGVLVLMPREDRFAVSFDAADDEAFLMFGPNAKYGDRFSLLAQEWQQETGQVHYRDKVYTVDAASAFSSLMVDLQRVGNNKYESRDLPGRTVNQ